MVRLSSTGAVLGALSGAAEIDVLAYTLRRGAVLAGLEAAARRGAHVRVRLEGAPYGDPSGSFARANGRIVDELAACGADARLAHSGGGASSGQAPVHAKAIVADSSLFLDDRNWGPADFVVSDDDADDAATVRAALGGVAGGPRSAAFAIRKRDALDAEAALIRAAGPADDAIVESETFGYGNSVFAALDALGKAGVQPRLLVSSREAKNKLEASALARLANDGVRVRTCRDSEKFAVAGNGAWIGSANASAAFGKPDMIDWGLRTCDDAIVAEARARVEARWAGAKPLPAPCADL